MRKTFKEAVSGPGEDRKVLSGLSNMEETYNFKEGTLSGRGVIFL